MGQDRSVSKVVYVLGAGFNCSILNVTAQRSAPLARNFFRVLLKSPDKLRLNSPNVRKVTEPLFAEIQRYWKLDTDALATKDFDIEECLTFFESRGLESNASESASISGLPTYALRYLLLLYLSGMSRSGVHSPLSLPFGQAVLGGGADVITFNYDTLAEAAIELASGCNTVLSQPPPPSGNPSTSEVDDRYLNHSHFSWNKCLAYGFEFDEVELPVAGNIHQVAGNRYYGHPSNKLYKERRALKLHGSIDWLRYTKVPRMVLHGGDVSLTLPAGILLSRATDYWDGELPTRDGLYMDPEIIPPQLFKAYNHEPYSSVWREALNSLSECEELFVIGYSFPPTDFRTRRLFLEAFSDHALRKLTVVNPDLSVVQLVRDLAHYQGPVLTCDSLQALYDTNPPD